MGDRFDDLRNKIKSTLLSSSVESALLLIIDELEKIHNEVRQGFSRPDKDTL